eukprot:COSAG05_NODE_2104_length_3554_cov_6.450362_3_plen_113_part_00
MSLRVGVVISKVLIDRDVLHGKFSTTLCYMCHIQQSETRPQDTPEQECAGRCGQTRSVRQYLGHNNRPAPCAAVLRRRPAPGLFVPGLAKVLLVPWLSGCIDTYRRPKLWKS